jgi:hypothetical protein
MCSIVSLTGFQGPVFQKIGFGSDFQGFYPTSMRLQCDAVSDTK